MKPIVAIVGRPNVGKSTLFNRILGGRKAIVEDTPGITRDRLYHDCNWAGRDFILIDTGGIEFDSKSDSIETAVYNQVILAIEEADVIIMCVDGKTGLVSEDERSAMILRRSGKPIVLCVNKVDNFANNDYLEFYSLGLGEPIPVSSLHGMNVGDLLDAVLKKFPPIEEYDDDPDTIRFALIGRPNVGKSSLTNALLGKDRSVVSDVPGTTRDAIDTPFTYRDRKYVIMDTAGMRKRGKISETTEKYSIIRALRAIDSADLVLILIDATAGVIEQDKKIVGYAHEEGKGVIIVVNKWDAIEKDGKTINKFEKDIREEMAFLNYAPILYVSALTGQRVDKIMDMVDFVSEQQNLRVSTSRLNEVINESLLMNPPPTDKGKRLKVFYSTQIGVKPPRFAVFVNDPELMHFSYKRYLLNQLRINFGFEGSPVWLIIRPSHDKE